MRKLAFLLAVAALVGGCGGDTKTVTQTTPAAATPAGSAGADFDARRIYKRDGPGVVTVLSSAGQGSGFVVSEKGEIVTNTHVVTRGTGAAIRRAASVFVIFPDDNRVEAEIVGIDPYADVALLKLDPDGLSLRPLPLGSTRDLEVGAPVVAIGSPFGEEQSLSVGVVSATDRAIESLTGFQTTGAIQTDAAINHGNSGGPLLDASGRVLGINSQIRTTTGDGTGVGFAVPVDTVKRSLAQLRDKGRVHYAFIGVSSAPLYPQLVERFKLPVRKGVWVQEIVPGGPADDAGLRAGGPLVNFQGGPWLTGGDVIVRVGRAAIDGDDDLATALLAHEPGDTVEVELFRDGKRRTLDVKLGERPLNDPDRG